MQRHARTAHHNPAHVVVACKGVITGCKMCARAHWLVWAAIIVCIWHPQLCQARRVVIRNDVARRAVDGSYVDAHDGKILAVNGTYYLYGEAYGNQTLATPYPWSAYPRLAVYTSPDLVTWTYRGAPLASIPNTLWIPSTRPCQTGRQASSRAAAPSSRHAALLIPDFAPPPFCAQMSSIEMGASSCGLGREAGLPPPALTVSILPRPPLTHFTAALAPRAAQMGRVCLWMTTGLGALRDHGF